MHKIKVLLLIILLNITILATIVSAITLVIFSFQYLWYKEDIDINALTVSFYLTFGLALLTALLSTYVYVFKEELFKAS